MVMNASQAGTKYFVNGTSPGRFSCGIILSTRQMIFVCLFFFTSRKIVPRAGAISGSQNRTTTISGFHFLIWLPTLNQLIGFTELMSDWIFIPSGAGSGAYCVVPGNKKEGY